MTKNITQTEISTLKIQVLQAIRKELSRVKSISMKGYNRQVARTLGISETTISRVGKGEDVAIGEASLIRVAEILGLTWIKAETEVYEKIRKHILYCQQSATSTILVDGCGIGKTYSAKQVQRNLENCYYVDASQCKTRTLFAKALAEAIGVSLRIEVRGKVKEIRNYNGIKSAVKDALANRTKQVVIIDEAGDLDYQAFCDIKEYWNATKGVCGWYLMGADGLRHKIEQGRKREIQSFEETFSRFAANYKRITPIEDSKRLEFYKTLAEQILRANYKNSGAVGSMNKIKDAFSKNIEKAGFAGGIRAVEAMLIAASVQQNTLSE